MKILAFLIVFFCAIVMQIFCSIVILIWKFGFLFFAFEWISFDYFENGRQLLQFHFATAPIPRIISILNFAEICTDNLHRDVIEKRTKMRILYFVRAKN